VQPDNPFRGKRLESGPLHFSVAATVRLGFLDVADQNDGPKRFVWGDLGAQSPSLANTCDTLSGQTTADQNIRNETTHLADLRARSP
jgi:hypothetical protein